MAVITTEELRKMYEENKEKGRNCRQCGRELLPNDWQHGPCYDCTLKNINNAEGDRMADHLLRRVQTDSDFRVALRKALAGVGDD